MSARIAVVAILLCSWLSSAVGIKRGADFEALVEPWNGTIEVRSGGALEEYVGELLVIGVYAADSGDVPLTFSPAVKAFDEKYAGSLLAEVATEEGFMGESGTYTNVIYLAGSKVKRVVLYGMGVKDSSTLIGRQIGGASIRAGIHYKSCKSVGLFVEDATPDMVAGLVEGAMMSGYVDERYKSVKAVTSTLPRELRLIGVDLESDENKIAAFTGRETALGVILTRQITGSPADIATPQALSEVARKIATDSGLEVEVLSRDQCTEMGMGSYLSVGQGSIYEPQFIHLTYKPTGEVKKKVAFVGKTITFDSGGYNLKVGGGSLIELMKYDMSGGGAVLGSAKVIGKLKPANVEVHFIVPAIENMVNGKATHPGDIFMASNGKTVEVVNTDAEGRLTLADALVFAENLKNVDYIIDIATLTGSVISALGSDLVGMWSPSDSLAQMITECGMASGEQMWRMPLVESYFAQMQSNVADLRNVGTGSSAGSITAALFLREFVTTENWVHLDIAGTLPSSEVGVGFGVRTFVNFVNKLSLEGK